MDSPLLIEHSKERPSQIDAPLQFCGEHGTVMLTWGPDTAATHGSRRDNAGCILRSYPQTAELMDVISFSPTTTVTRRCSHFMVAAASTASIAGRILSQWRPCLRASSKHGHSLACSCT